MIRILAPMIRPAAAILLAFAGLALMWFAIWGLLVIGWMPGATPEDMAWRFTVGLLSFAVGAAGITLIAFAGVTLAPVVSAIRDKITTTPS